MPTPLTDEQAGFSGGYNPNVGRVAEALNQFSAMANVRVLPSGEIAKRPGIQLLATVGGAMSIFCYRPVAGTVAVISDANGGIQTGTFFGTITLTSRATGSVRHVSAAHFRDGSAECLYMACGTGMLSKYQGTTFSDRSIGLSLNLKHVWVYNQRLFGITGVDQTLYWSAINNGDTIGDTSVGGGSATIRTYGGQVLVNGFALGDVNVLQHKTALSKFVGLTFDDIAIQAGTKGVSADAGSLGLNSACVVDGVAYCVDSRGLYLLTSDGTVTRYDSPTTPDPVLAFMQADRLAASAPVLVAFNARAKEVWIDVLGNTSQIYFYSTAFRRFTGNMGGSDRAEPLSAMTSIDETGGSPQFVLGYSTNFKIGGVDFRGGPASFVDMTGTISGGNTSSVTCRRFFTDSPLAEKSWDVAVVQAGSGSLGAAQSPGTVITPTVSYTTPVGGTVSQSTVALASDRVTRVPLSGSGEWVDVTIADTGGATGWSIASVAVQAADLGTIGR